MSFYRQASRIIQKLPFSAFAPSTFISGTVIRPLRTLRLPLPSLSYWLASCRKHMALETKTHLSKEVPSHPFYQELGGAWEPCYRVTVGLSVGLGCFQARLPGKWPAPVRQGNWHFRDRWRVRDVFLFSGGGSQPFIYLPSVEKWNWVFLLYLVALCTCRWRHRLY